MFVLQMPAQLNYMSGMKLSKMGEWLAHAKLCNKNNFMDLHLNSSYCKNVKVHYAIAKSHSGNQKNDASQSNFT